MKKPTLLLLTTGLISSCFQNEGLERDMLCDLPNTKMSISLTSLVSRADLQIKPLNATRYAVEFSAYDPRNNQMLYTAVGEGKCFNQLLNVVFTHGSNEIPQLKVASGEFVGVFSKGIANQHFGKWKVLVQQVGDLGFIPFQVKEINGKKYIEDGGFWTTK